MATTPPASELPLRFHEVNGVLVLRCLCGRELATWRRGITELAGMRQAVPLAQLAGDVSRAGILTMLIHARKCTGALA
jgi:hypothetical protein